MFDVGDGVYDERFGYGVVVRIDYENELPLLVEFSDFEGSPKGHAECYMRSYLEDGTEMEGGIFKKFLDRDVWN